MLSDGMELSGHLRYEALLEEAEAHRLRKRVATQPANQAGIIWQVRCWLGTQLVTWGHQLQGYHLAAQPQLFEHEPSNG